MLRIGVLLTENGGLKAAYTTFSHKGRRKFIALQKRDAS